MFGKGAKPSRRGLAALAFLAALSMLPQTALAAPGDIVTYAGGGSTACCDGAQATAARVLYPSGAVYDTTGNLYVADTDNNRIRKIDTLGVISTVAGTGVCGYANGWGPSARLCRPTGLAFDVVGGQSLLHFADRETHTVRTLNLTTGYVTTLAGTGTPGFNGDGFPLQIRLSAPQGVAVDAAHNVYIADTLNHRVRKLTASTGLVTTVAGIGLPLYFGDGLPAILAGLNAPTGVALDGAGTMYIADRDNDVIRTVSAMGIIDTLIISLHRPLSVSRDALNNRMYFADSGGNRVVMYDVATQTEWTVAGNGVYWFSGDGGLAAAASLAYPAAVAVHPSGTVLAVADRDNHRVRRVNLTTNIITTMGGVGFHGDTLAGTDASLKRPPAVAVDKTANLLYIADREHQRVRRVDIATGVITTVAGGGYKYIDGMKATEALIVAPSGIALDPTGTYLYVSDEASQVVRRVNLVTNAISTYAGNGDGCVPKGDPYLCGDFGPATSAKLSSPNGLATDAAGNLYIADTATSAVRRVSTAGQINTVAGSFCPTIAGCPLGDGGPGNAASVQNPRGVAVDSVAGKLYVADTGNNRVRVVNLTTGIITTAAGCTVAFCGLGDGGPATSATLSLPYGVTVDNATGRLYIGDTFHHRVRKVSLGTGIISTVAGNGAGNLSGDGFPAAWSGLNRPMGIALDAAGNMYIADESNDRVRRIFAPVP